MRAFIFRVITSRTANQRLSREGEGRKEEQIARGVNFYHASITDRNEFHRETSRRGGEENMASLLHRIYYAQTLMSYSFTLPIL
jgi:hypothetical protein